MRSLDGVVVRGGRAALVVVCVASAGLLGGCGGDAMAEPSSASPQAPVTPGQASLEYPQWETVEPGEHLSYNQRASLIQRGHLVYQRYCVGCHGEFGDGEGPASDRLITKPRDFTKGIYKFRSTDSSSLPLEQDLHRTITRGLARVSMPAFPLMPESERLAVVEYIKTFYPQWDQRQGRRRVVAIPQTPPDLASDERILRGRGIYLAAQCWKCHGVDGRGTGATQEEYTDAWGFPQKPFDFTRGELKGGSFPQDVYRTFHAGLRSIMPSFGGDTLARVSAAAFTSITDVVDTEEWERLQPFIDELPKDSLAVAAMTPSQFKETAEGFSWDLVAYTLSLRAAEETTAEAVLGSREIED